MAAITVTQGNVVAGAPTTLTLGSTDLGPTVGGLRYRKETTWSDVDVDQCEATIKKIFNKAKFYVASVLGESSLVNLQTAWGQPATDLSGSTLNATSEELGEAILVFVGEGAGVATAIRTVTMHRTIALSAGETAYTNEGGAQIPVEWECLWDSSVSRFGTIIDTAP